LNTLKTLLAESLDNVLVAGSVMFLFTAFFSALVEPKAALVPLAVGVGCYLFARLKDKD